MPAYTNPRPSAPEPSRGDGSGTRVTASGGSTREERPQPDLSDATPQERAETINEAMWGPGTATKFN